MQEVLVLYYSHRGSVRALAELIARGIDAVPGVSARLRTVPRVSTVCESTEPDIPDQGAPYAVTVFRLLINSSTASASTGMSAKRSIGLSRVTRMLFSRRMPSFSSRM